MVLDLLLEFLYWQWAVNWLLLCLAVALVLCALNFALAVCLLPLHLFEPGRSFARDVFKGLARAARACVRSGVDGFP